MQPLMILMDAEGRNSRKAAVLARQLKRRGLHVLALKTQSERVPKNVDVILLPRNFSQINGLAEQIEQFWHDRWDDWYHQRKGLKRNEVRRVVA